jgi:hypothetical protein
MLLWLSMMNFEGCGYAFGLLQGSISVSEGPEEYHKVPGSIEVYWLRSEALMSLV